MKTLAGAIILLVVTILQAPAATLYVNLNSTNPVPPYASWSTAAANIQDAVDASTNGDLILVTNGVYAIGGRTVNGFSLTNRVAVTKPVTLQSINGPATTSIRGYSLLGNSAVRCVYLTNNAQLIGFTLTNGGTEELGYYDQELGGGGVFCESSNSVISNCVMSGNCAYLVAGAAYSGTLEDCVLSSNLAFQGEGGGAALSMMMNCVLSNNSSLSLGGGAYDCSLTNCALYNNQAGNEGGGAAGCTMNNCTVNSNTASYDGGGTEGGTLRGCTLVGNSALNGVDGGGGAYGGVLNNCVLSNNWSGTSGGGVVDAVLTNCILSGNFATNGSGGGACEIGSDAKCTLYNCTLMDNYASGDGGGAYESLLVNCTLIHNHAGNSGGGTAFQCKLSYCTLSTNFALNGGGDYLGTLTNCTLIGNSASLGGADYESTLTQCQLTGNLATNGGGDYHGYLYNCTLDGNSALNDGGGTWEGTLSGCVVSNNLAATGGGAYGEWLYNCLIVSNTANLGGGGCNIYRMINCTVVGNTASDSGGGLAVDAAAGYSGNWNSNSIIMFNTALYDPNYSNRSNTMNVAFGFGYCCTTPLPPAPFSGNNITNDPRFVNLAGGDFRLQSNSPCINAGNNGAAPAGPDLDGNPRIVGGTVDIGAYECQSPALLNFYVWLQGYGLPTAASATYTDYDGTGFNVYQDWIAGLDPTNSLSVLAMLSPVPTNNPAGLIVSWESVSNRTYFLQSSTNLAAQPAFSTIQSNIVGQPDMTSLLDTNAVGNGPFFYRVGVQ